MSTEHDFDLWPFQQEVFDHIMNGEKKRVILQAPTGAGKTRAALAPFIHHLGHKADKDFSWERLPLTCRYAVPTRTLANQFYREYCDLAVRLDDAMPTRIEDEYKRIERNAISIQTGEQSNDPQMEAALTFCTIDQLLASSIAIPYGLGKNLANINVAAVAGSYLILDEFHLYPLLRGGKSCFGALTTAMKMLCLLKETTPFVLMTATFSTTLLNTLAELLDARVVTITNPTELGAIAGGRVRTFERSLLEMNAKIILDQHEMCSLVVCNTVARAQKIWRELKEEVERTHRNIDIVLLHSRFTEERRKACAEDIERELGPALQDTSCGWKNGEYHGRNIIVVATQIVEVGLNVSVQTLHTEIAPASSIIQRAGRCARFHEQRGRVIVYQLPSNSDTNGGKASSLPYDDRLCGASWDALEYVDGKEVGFAEEQKLINIVHTVSDKEMLRAYEDNKTRIFAMIAESFNKNEYSVSSELIRDVAQVQVLIHDDPVHVITEVPWLWQSFSLHPRSLEKWWKTISKVKETLSDIEWVCKKAELYAEGDPDEPDNKLKMKCKWIDITNSSQILSVPMVVIPRKLAWYDDEVGFALLNGTSNGGEYQSVKRKPVDEHKRYKKIVQQSYKDHISGLLRAYDSHIWSETRYIATRLEKAMHLPNEVIDQAIRLAIACHDFGKLDKQWQLWARTWQSFVMKGSNPPYQLPGDDFIFAKTEYDYSREHKNLQRSIQLKRPHHACESVVLARDLIGMSLDVDKDRARIPLLRAVCGAIARHHTSQAHEYGKTQLVDSAKEVTGDVLQLVQSKKAWNYDLQYLHTIINKGDLQEEERPDRFLTRPKEKEITENKLETLLYFVIVRALRLADQRA